jgi:hypothetical protein
MSSEEHGQEQHSHLTMETLISAIILIVFTISAPLFEKYHFHYLHESGLCMLIGIVITLFLRVVSPSVFNLISFNSYFLFIFIYFFYSFQNKIRVISQIP